MSFGSLTNPAPSLEGFLYGIDVRRDFQSPPLFCQIVVGVDSTLLSLNEGVRDGVKILIAFRKADEGTIFE